MPPLPGLIVLAPLPMLVPARRSVPTHAPSCHARGMVSYSAASAAASTAAASTAASVSASAVAAEEEEEEEEEEEAVARLAVRRAVESCLSSHGPAPVGRTEAAPRSARPAASACDWLVYTSGCDVIGRAHVWLRSDWMMKSHSIKHIIFINGGSGCCAFGGGGKPTGGHV